MLMCNPFILRHFRSLISPLLLSCIVSWVHASTKQAWVGSWYASPIPAAQEPVNLPPGTKVPPCVKFPEPPVAPRFEDATLRTIVHLTVGGDRLRVRLSNLYGRTALNVGAAHVYANGVGNKVTF